MDHIKIDEKTKQAIESVLSKGERVEVVPMKGGGVRVREATIKTVYVQK